MKNTNVSVNWKDFSEAQSIVCQACIARTDDSNEVCSTCPVHKTAGMYYKEIDSTMLYQAFQKNILHYRIEKDTVWLLFGFQYLSAPRVKWMALSGTKQEEIETVVCSVMPTIREMHSTHNDNSLYVSLLRYLMANLNQ